MGMYLDLDDVVADNPVAKAELAALRTERDRLREIAIAFYTLLSAAPVQGRGCGQTVGSESYRLWISGANRSEWMDKIEDALKGEQYGNVPRP